MGKKYGKEIRRLNKDEFIKQFSEKDGDYVYLQSPSTLPTTKIIYEIGNVYDTNIFNEVTEDEEFFQDKELTVYYKERDYELHRIQKQGFEELLRNCRKFVAEQYNQLLSVNEEDKYFYGEVVNNVLITEMIVQ